MNKRWMWVAVVWVAVFVLTAMTPLLADDFPNLRGFYRLSPLAPGQFPTWETFVGVPDFWGNLFRLTWEHWSGAGASLVDNTGRFAAAFLLRFLVGMPHWLFAALNATVWVWLTWCVWRLGGRSRRWLGATAAAMLVFALNWDACLWVSGACNYLWPMAWTLALALLFLRPRLGESVFVWRNVWMVSLLPLGFLAAGGHELIDLPICLTLTVYWLREMARGRFTINGRLLLTVGFGLGALAVVFAPAALGRAGNLRNFFPEGEVLVPAARAMMATARCAVANPLLVAMAGVTVVALVWRRRLALSERAWWTLLAGWLTVALTGLLSDGRARAAWPAAVAGLLMVQTALPAVRRVPWGRWRGRLTATLVALAGRAVARAGGMTALRTAVLGRAVAAWRANPDCVMREPTVRVWRPLAWFDRTWLPSFFLEWGGGEESCNTPAVAWFYGKPFCLLLDADTWTLLYERDAFIAPENRLACPGAWYTRADADLVVAPLPKGTSLRPGTTLLVIPTYRDAPAPLSPLEVIRSRILRRGWAEFSEISPEQEMASGYRLWGFVLGTPHGDYVVARHNRAISREKIAELRIEVLPPRQ